MQNSLSAAIVGLCFPSVDLSHKRQLFIQYQFNQYCVKTVYDTNPLKMEKQVLKEDYSRCNLQCARVRVHFCRQHIT